MRYVDLLKATVLLSGGSATALAAATLLGATRNDVESVALISAAWWAVASIVGVVLGRRAEVNPPIARALAAAKSTTTMPEVRPGATLLNRLWPLLLCVVVAGGLAVVIPQAAGIAAGFTIIWALAWRRQEHAVRAIEERDGVTFYVERTSPVSPLSLVRAPGFRRERKAAA
jgi:hypothetical protein